ncbi:MAG: hypothetical protein HWD89_12790 [Tenacibaculum sp.]|uniref:hypothetical protein n=1 Tax=Tenacibaculum TaxID=104267 RepID=UPI00184C3D8C|nr:hypothetical protein [Tenacibaculum sp.]NVK09921.1 hypothetical protein [Tenacibaculum sp.]
MMRLLYLSFQLFRYSIWFLESLLDRIPKKELIERIIPPTMIKYRKDKVLIRAKPIPIKIRLNN